MRWRVDNFWCPIAPRRLLWRTSTAVPAPTASFRPLTQLFLIDKHWVDHRARQSRKWAKFRPQFTKACNLAQLDGLASSSGWQTIWYPCVQVGLWTIAKDRYFLFYKFEFTQSENRRQKCWVKVVNEPNLGWSAISLTLIDYLRRLLTKLSVVKEEINRFSVFLQPDLFRGE